MALRPALPKEEAARGAASLRECQDANEEEPSPGSLNISTPATTANSPFSDPYSRSARESSAAMTTLLSHPDLDSCSIDPDQIKQPRQGQLQQQQQQEQNRHSHHVQYSLMRHPSAAFQYHHQEQQQPQLELEQEQREEEKQQQQQQQQDDTGQNLQLLQRQGAGPSFRMMMPPPVPPLPPLPAASGTARPTTPHPVVHVAAAGAASSRPPNALGFGAAGSRHKREVALYGGGSDDSKGDGAHGIGGCDDSDLEGGSAVHVRPASGHLAVLPQVLCQGSEVASPQPQQPQQPNQPRRPIQENPQQQQQHEADDATDQAIASLGALLRNNSSFGRAGACATVSGSNPSTPVGNTGAALTAAAAAVAAAVGGSGSGNGGGGGGGGGTFGDATTAAASPRGSDTASRGSQHADAVTAWGQPPGPGHGPMGRKAGWGETSQSVLAWCASAEGCEGSVLCIVNPDQATPKPSIGHQWNGWEESRVVRMSQQQLQQPKIHDDGGDGGGVELRRASYHRPDLDPDSHADLDQNPSWESDGPHPEDSTPYFTKTSHASLDQVQELAPPKRGRTEIHAVPKNGPATAAAAVTMTAGKRARRIEAAPSMAAAPVAAADAKTEGGVTAGEAEAAAQGGDGEGPQSLSYHQEVRCSETKIDENRTKSAVQLPVVGSSPGQPQDRSQPNKLTLQPPYSPCQPQQPSEDPTGEAEPPEALARPQALTLPPPAPPTSSAVTVGTAATAAAAAAAAAGPTPPVEGRPSTPPEPIFVTVAASISKRSRAAAGDATAAGAGRRGKIFAAATASAATAAAVKVMATAQSDDGHANTCGGDDAAGGDASGGGDAAATMAGMPPMSLLRQRRAVTLGQFVLYLRPEMTCTVLGVFHPKRYLDMTECIECPPDSGNFITRSHFEKVGGAATAKWYRSIRVLPSLEYLGNWLTRLNLPVFKGVGRRRARRSNAGDQGEPCPATGSPKAVATNANAPATATVPTAGAAAARTATTGNFADPGGGSWPGMSMPPAVAAAAATAQPLPLQADFSLKELSYGDASMPVAAAMAEALAEAAAAAEAEEPAGAADPYGTWYDDEVPNLAPYRSARLSARQLFRSGALQAMAKPPPLPTAAAAPLPPPFMPPHELCRIPPRTCGALEGRWSRALQARHVEGAPHDIGPLPRRYDKSAVPFLQNTSQIGGWSQRGSVRPMGHRNAGTRGEISVPALEDGCDDEGGIAGESGRAGDRGGSRRSAESGGDGAVLLRDALNPWLAAAAAAATMPLSSWRSTSAAFWRDRVDPRHAPFGMPLSSAVGDAVDDVDGAVQPSYISQHESRNLHRAKSADLAESLAAPTSARSHTTWSELPFESPSAAAAPSLPVVPTVLRRAPPHSTGLLTTSWSRNQGGDDVIYLQQPQEQIRFRSESDPSAIRLSYETQHPSPQQPLRRGSHEHHLDSSLGGGNDKTTTLLIDKGDGGGGGAVLPVRQQPHQSNTTPHLSQYHRAPTDPGWRPLRPPYTHAPPHDQLPYGSAGPARAMPRPLGGPINRPRAPANLDPVAIVNARPRRSSYELYDREFMTLARQAPRGGVGGPHAAAPPGGGSGGGSGARPPQREAGCDNFEDALLEPAPEPTNARDYVMWLKSEKHEVPLLLAAAATMAGEEVAAVTKPKAEGEMGAGVGPPQAPHVSRTRQRGEPPPPPSLGLSSRPFATSSTAAATVAFSGRADRPLDKSVRQQSLPSPPTSHLLSQPPRQQLQLHMPQQRKQQQPQQLQHFGSDELVEIQLGTRQQQQLELELIQMQLKRMQQQQFERRERQRQQQQQLLARQHQDDLLMTPAATATTWRRLESLPYRVDDASPYNMPYNDGGADADDAGGGGGGVGGGDSGGSRTVDNIDLPQRWNWRQQQQQQQSWDVRSREEEEEEEDLALRIEPRIPRVTPAMASPTASAAAAAAAAATAAAAVTAPPGAPGAGRKRRLGGSSSTSVQ